jgi:hypothetical protein
LSPLLPGLSPRKKLFLQRALPDFFARVTHDISGWNFVETKARYSGALNSCVDVGRALDNAGSYPARIRGRLAVGPPITARRSTTAL